MFHVGKITISLVVLAMAVSTRLSMAQTGTAEIAVEVDMNKTVGPLEHIWSKCGGSDRAAITLREQWRKDLTRIHQEAGLETVRFHGIFADELDVWGLQPNWQNVDLIYDGLLERGVRPFVELSFMPAKLASGTKTFGFYRANVTPPKDWAQWGDFVEAFVKHLVDRYGIEEVRHWHFEVWNEPNLTQWFWTGTQADYFELYKTSVTAVKAVDSRLKVGGPSTANAGWIPEFLAYCSANALPVDFVSTHVYPGDDQSKIFGESKLHPTRDVIPAAMAQVRAQIDATKYAGVPLVLSEWSSDSPALIAHIIKSCLGVCQVMSHWTFSGTYEENGVSRSVLKEGNSGWGMTTPGGIPKPQFNTYKLLHRLGKTRLATSDGPVLASRREDGSSAVAIWNLAEVSQPAGLPGETAARGVVKGEAKQVRILFKGARLGQSIKVWFVDENRGSPYPEWRKFGSPRYPTAAQREVIRKSAELQEPEMLKLGDSSEVTLTLPPEGFALIEIDAK